MGRRGYRREFQRRTRDLVGAGQEVAQVAAASGISVESIYAWRRQDRIDRGLAPGLSSMERSELGAVNKRIAELETELAAHHRASDLPKVMVPPRGSTRRSR